MKTIWYVSDTPVPAWLRTGIEWLEKNNKITPAMRAKRSALDEFRDKFPPGVTPAMVCDIVSSDPKGSATLALLAGLASGPDDIAKNWVRVQRYAERELVAELNDATVAAVLDTNGERIADAKAKLAPLLEDLSEIGRLLPVNAYHAPADITQRTRGAEFAEKFAALCPLWSLALANGIEFEDIATGTGRRDLKPEFFLSRDGVRISDGTEPGATGPDGEDIEFVGKAAA
ncbi:MAG TPA: hypothetical protein VJ870_01550 [Amycolatopsis sp.]|nr:hypothetical protein [Amycolatopsis sp.]